MIPTAADAHYGPDVSVLAVVPARGGSKGLVGKNLRTVGGIPLVGRAVEAGLRARTVDRVVVSTDDQEIAAVAEAFGADVLRRPAALATDEAASIDVVLHALTELEMTGGTFDVVALVQPTSPLREPADVDATIDALVRGDAPVAISVCDAGTAHPSYLYWARGGAVAEPVVDGVPARRQDHETAYRRNGAVYAARTDYVRRSRSLLAPRVSVHVMPETRSVNVDDEVGLRLAEHYASHASG